MDLKNLQGQLSKLMNSKDIANLGGGQLAGVINNLKQGKKLSDAEREGAVALVKQFAKFIDPAQGKQILQMLEQLGDSNLSAKDKKALQEIKGLFK